MQKTKKINFTELDNIEVSERTKTEILRVYPSIAAFERSLPEKYTSYFSSTYLYGRKSLPGPDMFALYHLMGLNILNILFEPKLNLKVAESNSINKSQLEQINELKNENEKLKKLLSEITQLSTSL